jgi:hypothetical protein
MSNNTMLYEMYRMGYHGRATVHGFRSLASTLLNEMGFPSDWIERQLTHDERNKIGGAYSAAQYLEGRHRDDDPLGGVPERRWRLRAPSRSAPKRSCIESGRRSDGAAVHQPFPEFDLGT